MTAFPGFTAPPAWLDDSWMDDAACRGDDVDPRIFFPTRTDHSRAFAVCRRCLVKPECLHYALVTESEGVWAGTSERERERIRTRHRLNLRSVSS